VAAELNKVDLDEEPFMEVDGQKEPLTVGYNGTSDATFLKMVRPAFSKEMIDKDIEAILRRATVILNTDWWVYVRPGGVKNSVTIQRHKAVTRSYVTDEAIACLKRATKHGEWPDADTFKKEVVQEQILFRQLLRKQLPAHVKQEQLDNFYDANRRLAQEPPILVESPVKKIKSEASSSSAPSSGPHWKESLFRRFHKKLSDDSLGDAIRVDSDSAEEGAGGEGAEFPFAGDEDDTLGWGGGIGEDIE